eukprot:scaffold11294_cov56-Cyclotella_meneghiniana.AAC.7
MSDGNVLKAQRRSTSSSLWGDEIREDKELTTISVSRKDADADADRTSAHPNDTAVNSDIKAELEHYLGFLHRMQHIEMPLANEYHPSELGHKPINAEPLTPSNPSAKLNRNNRLDVETQYDDLLRYQVYDRASKKNKPGIESIDDDTSPIPPSQDDSLLQYQVNDEATKRDKPSIETIDDMTFPIPPSYDSNLLYQGSTSKTDRPRVECIEDTSSPIPPSQDANLLQYPISDSANKFKGLLPDELFPSDNIIQMAELGTEEERVGMNTSSSTSNGDSLREVSPPIFTAETATLSSTRGFTNNAGDILIPFATLVQEQSSSIQDASVIEPEKNAVIVMGRKISHRILILGVAVVLAVVVALAVALTMKPEPSVYPTSSPSTSMYPSSTPSDLASIITERTGYDEGAFSNKQSTRRIALDWLVQDLKSAQTVSRTTSLNYSDIEIFERFTMALIYYETGGAEWDDSYNFLSSNHICKWRGKRALQKKGIIKCLGNQLTVLNVGDNHVSSPLPPLNNLVNLTQIVMNHNDLNGLIPDLSALSRLYTLDLSENEFQGNLFDVSNLTQLQTFKVSGNKVSGEVPLSFRDINLTSLHLERTMLNGSVDFLCEHIPSMDITLDCYDEMPELQCNCCVGCTFVTRECNIDNEVIARIDIAKAVQDLTWWVYSIQTNNDYEHYDDDIDIAWGSNGTERVLVAAGGMYDEGESANVSLCLSFPGDYLLKTNTNGTTDNDDVFSIGDLTIPLNSNSYWGNQWSMFSLDSDGLVYDVPTSYPTWSPTTTLSPTTLSPTWQPTTTWSPTTTLSPTKSPVSTVPTSSQNPSGSSISQTDDVATDDDMMWSIVANTTAPTPGVYRPTPFPTNYVQGDANLCFEIQLSTDAFGEETTYYIYNKHNSTPVVTKSSFDSNMTYDFEECVDSKGCYYFVIVDEFEDGICCDQGHGNYSATMNGRVIGHGGDFNSSDTLHIGGSCSLEPEENSCQDGFALLNVTVKADTFGPSENDWSVWSSNEIVAVNKRELGLDVSSELVCLLETECYDYYIDDSYGDGWDTDEDAFWMIHFGGKIVGQGDGDFEYNDEITFGLGCT